MEKPLTWDDLRQVIDSVKDIPPSAVDSYRVHSRSEIQALYEFAERGERDPLRNPGAVFGIPIYIISDTPPGVLRSMLKGEVVADVPIR